MGVMKTPTVAKQKSLKNKTPQQKTPGKAVTPMNGGPHSKKVAKSVPSVILSTPKGTEHNLTTPKSSHKKKQKNKPATPAVALSSILESTDDVVMEKSPKSEKKKKKNRKSENGNGAAESPQSSGKKRRISESDDATNKDGPKLKQFAGTKGLLSPSTGSPSSCKVEKIPQEDLGNKKKQKKQLGVKQEQGKRKEEKAKKQLDVLASQVKSEPESPLKGVGEEPKPLSKSQKKRLKQKLRHQAHMQKEGSAPSKETGTKNVEKSKKKKQKKQKVAKVDESKNMKEEDVKMEDEDEEEVEEEEIDVTQHEFPSVKDEEDSEESDESDYEVEKSIVAEKVSKTLKYDADEADSDLANKLDKKVDKKKAKKAKAEKQTLVDPATVKKEDVIEKGKKRYVVFVGNLPFTADQNELREHFKNCGTIVSVRIPKDAKSNKPRGFAYVEVSNPESFEKALSMHQSQLGGRRINVSYTLGGKKNSDKKKTEIRNKNLKLHAMRRSGMLAGSKKDTKKRADRRTKARKFAKKENENKQE